jgi:plastocyanin
MSRNARIVLIVAAVAVAVVAFVIANDSGSEKARTPTTTVIHVKGGKPVGGIEDIAVNQGDRVRFVVESDVGDEVHVHGYDFHKDVPAGGRVAFDFKATIDGVFVIELESRGEQIASLKVNP